MSNYVLDSSAFLAAVFDEPGAERVQELLDDAIMSAVNLAEVASKLIDRAMPEDDVHRLLAAARFTKAPFDEAAALVTGSLRTATRKSGLSLGDRACLALALLTDATVLTADRNWRRVNVGVTIEIIR